MCVSMYVSVGVFNDCFLSSGEGGGLGSGITRTCGAVNLDLTSFSRSESEQMHVIETIVRKSDFPYNTSVPSGLTSSVIGNCGNSVEWA